MGFPSNQEHLSAMWMPWVFCVVCCDAVGSIGVVPGTRTGLWMSSDLCFRLLLMKLDIVTAAHPENPKLRISALFLGT